MNGALVVLFHLVLREACQDFAGILVEINDTSDGLSACRGSFLTCSSFCVTIPRSSPDPTWSAYCHEFSYTSFYKANRLFRAGSICFPSSSSSSCLIRWQSSSYVERKRGSYRRAIWREAIVLLARHIPPRLRPQTADAVLPHDVVPFYEGPSKVPRTQLISLLSALIGRD